MGMRKRGDTEQAYQKEAEAQNQDYLTAKRELEEVRASKDDIYETLLQVTKELEKYKAEGKPLYESKTIWTLFIGSVISVLTIKGVTVPEEFMQYKDGIASVLVIFAGALAVWFRKITKGSRLTLKKNGQ